MWKCTSGLVICKQRKDDYTKLKANRFMTLISCMGKVVENVVAELPAEEDE